MLPIVQVGPLAVQVPGLVLLLGLWLGLLLAEREARRWVQGPGRVALDEPPAGRRAPSRAGLTPDTLYNLALAGLVAALAGARLAYAARYAAAYAADPLGLLSPNPNTLVLPEGLALGLLAAVVYGARHRLPLRPTLDALAPAVAAMAIALALAHLASGDAFGAPTSLPWAIYLWDEYRHPSQVYELIAALGVLGAWRVSGRFERVPGSGRRFLWVVALLAAARVFLEAFRGDSLLMFGTLRAAQVWGLLALGGSLALMPRWAKPVTGDQ
jgi:phosphatidylglycerol:prolipoprotein diacylglycerol transferase